MTICGVVGQVCTQQDGPGAGWVKIYHRGAAQVIGEGGGLLKFNARWRLIQASALTDESAFCHDMPQDHYTIKESYGRNTPGGPESMRTLDSLGLLYYVNIDSHCIRSLVAMPYIASASSQFENGDRLRMTLSRFEAAGTIVFLKGVQLLPVRIQAAALVNSIS